MTNATMPVQEPNPGHIFDAINAYQRSAALKAAIQLDIFTKIADGKRTADEIAKAVAASPRGVRILSDFLVVHGFLTKDGESYGLGLDAATFLNRNSPAYIGSTVNFLLDPRLIAPFLDLTAVVRSGKTTLPGEGSVSADNPIWVEFATEMANMVGGWAHQFAELADPGGEITVLDIAAGHGRFGISIAERNPKARITALDWREVLAVATGNARKAGVADRYSSIAGDAFAVDFGGPYDVVLLTNFLHHFDPPTCERLMRKVLAALKPGGRCVTLEFVPNEDRVSPPVPASFAMMMLGSTPAGDAYTFSELEKMFRNAGFASSELHAIERSPQSVVVSHKR